MQRKIHCAKALRHGGALLSLPYALGVGDRKASNPGYQDLQPNDKFEHNALQSVLKDTWMTLEEIKQVVIPACREFKVKRLDLFGSLVRGEQTAASDVDLLVEFEEPDLHPSKRFFGLLHHLEDALGCEVDLITVSSFSNLYFRRRVLRERRNIYGG